MAICNDDFFGFYLHILSFIFAFIAAYLNNSVPGKMGLNYYICTGENPEAYTKLGSKVSNYLSYEINIQYIPNIYF